MVRTPLGFPIAVMLASDISHGALQTSLCTSFYGSHATHESSFRLFVSMGSHTEQVLRKDQSSLREGGYIWDYVGFRV